MRKGDGFIPAQRALQAEYGFRSYEEALRRWIATVAIIETGYVGEWEEYIHELTARDYLAEMVRLSPDDRQAVEKDLAPWDERFRAATVAETQPHLPPLTGEAGWWQYRSPKSWRKPSHEHAASSGPSSPL